MLFRFLPCICILYHKQLDYGLVDSNNRMRRNIQSLKSLKPLSLFISGLLMLKKAFDNVKIEKYIVKVVLALQ